MRLASQMVTRRGENMSWNEEKLQTFLHLKIPQSKVEVQRACGMAAQMKKFCPGVMLTFPLLQKLSSHSAVLQFVESPQGVHQVVTIGHKQEDLLLH